VIAKVRGFFHLFYSVPWCVPAWGWSEFVATVKALVTGTVVHGNLSERFADRVRESLGMKFVVPVNRGRTAIELGLRAMEIGAGDDVLMPSYVCRSVIDAVLSTGATPVFADIDETLNVTASTIDAALTPRTKCVIVAHLFGTAAPIDEIETLLASKGIALMDDAAQALGARRGGRPVGSFGIFGIVSCGPGKPLAGAAGGLLLTNDRQLFERSVAIELGLESASVVRQRALQFWVVRRFRRYSLPFSALLGRVRSAATEPVHVNAALANLDGAVALAQFEALERRAAERRQNAQILQDRLSTLPGKIVSDISPAGLAVKFVQVLPESGPALEEAIAVLARHGIEAQGGYSPLHRDRNDDANVPITTALWQRVLCVPLETQVASGGRIQFAQSAASRGNAIRKRAPLSPALPARE
jgi:dTDP-4-amino-4,6-dideoxygalactose transaminase